MILLGVLWWTATTSAQAPSNEKVESLERRLAVAPESEQVALLNELADLSWRSSPDKAREWAARALQLAKELDDPAGAATAHKLTALSYLASEDASSALPHLEEAHRLFDQIGNTPEAARVLGYQGMAFSRLGRLWPAVDAVRQALQLFRALDDTKGMAAATNNLGIYYEQLGEYEQALASHIESLGLEESLGRKQGIANNLNSLGNIRSRLGDHVEARENYVRALAIFEEIGDRYGTAQCLNNIGNTYEKLDQDDEALVYFDRSLKLAREIGNRSVEANPLVNIGIIQRKRGQYDLALKHFFAVVEIQTQLGRSAQLAGAYQNIAEIFLLQGRPTEARDYLLRAHAIGEQAESPEILESAYRGLAEAARARGDYRAALDYQIQYGQTRDRVLDEKRSQAIAALQEKYEAEKRREQIALLTKDNELLRKNMEIRKLELSRTRLTAFLMIVLTVLALGIGLLLFRRYLYLLAFWKKRSFIGPYRVEEELSRGGMGAVYRATSVVEPVRTVALKVIREELAGDEVQRQRFINEGKIIDALDHPNIVKVYERGEHNLHLYIAMEYLQGRTLAEVIEESARHAEMIPVARCLVVMRQLVDALATIHGKGIVHRDIKPTNVILTDDGRQLDHVTLLDFGAAKLDTLTTLTEAGEILGTFNYLAPERIQNGQATPSSDVFSLGVLFYELLTLEKPFLAEQPAEVFRQVLHTRPREPRQVRPDIDTDLSDLVMAMLEKTPASRPDDQRLLHHVTRLVEEAATP